MDQEQFLEDSVLSEELLASGDHATNDSVDVMVTSSSSLLECVLASKPEDLSLGEEDYPTCNDSPSLNETSRNNRIRSRGITASSRFPQVKRLRVYQSVLKNKTKNFFPSTMTVPEEDVLGEEQELALAIQEEEEEGQHNGEFTFAMAVQEENVLSEEQELALANQEVEEEDQHNDEFTIEPEYKNIQDPYNKKRFLGASHSYLCVSTTAMIKLEEMSKLLECVVCKALPMTSQTIHTCSAGHQTCGHCFNNIQNTCKVCENPLEGRNVVVEEFLKQLQQFCPHVFSLENLLDPELQMKLEEAEKQDLTAKIVHLSCHKVLSCPHEICKRRITSNGFHAHFEFEHPTIPVILTSLNCLHTFLLPWECLEDDLIRAVAILHVDFHSKKCESLAVRPDLTCERRVPAFPVRRDTVLCVLLCASVELNSTTYMATWCSSLCEDNGPLNYTIRVQVGSDCRHSYTGPTRSLHYPQDPELILQHSQCLLLAPGLLDLIFGEQQDSVSLDIQFTFI